MIGCVAYFVIVMLPETGADRHGHTLLMRLQDKLNPERHLRKLTEELAIAETNQNHYALANELARLGRYHEAVPHYQQALSGIFAHEAAMMLSLAQAQFAIQEFAACQQTLEDVMRYNPDLANEGKNPLVLDSKEPSLPLKDYIYNEARYKSLVASKPEVAEMLLEEEEKSIKARWRYYSHMAAMKMEG